MKDVEKSVVYAECPFCGQKITVLEDADDLEVYAKMHCKCSAALNFRNHENRKEALTDIIEWRCKDVPSIKGLLIGAMEILLSGQVKSLTIKGKDDKTYLISEKDGYLKFKDKELTEYESDEI